MMRVSAEPQQGKRETSLHGEGKLIDHIAGRFGVSRPYVSQVISKTSESEETLIPDHIEGHEGQAARQEKHFYKFYRSKA